MENVIRYQSRYKCTGLSVNKLKNCLYLKYDKTDINGIKISKCFIDLDHKVPYCISGDSSFLNLQLLTKNEHREKTAIDHKILRIFKIIGWIENLSRYEMKLNKNKEFLKIKYYELYKEIERIQNETKEQSNSL